MAERWSFMMSGADKQAIAELAERRRALGLPGTLMETIRASVALAATASDDDLKRGEL